MRSRPIAGAAFIIAAVWAAWWILFGIAAGIGEGLNAVGTVIHTLPGIIFAAATLVARKWHTLGGVALIAVAIGALWRFGYIPDYIISPGGLLMALPAVVAGLMFIAADRRTTV
ncbi:MAG: hypothetical protein WBK10_07740 [Bacillota bacterium]|nr:hypothetical protein [Bacillota bacterium]